MATFKIPAQNLSLNFPEIGEVFTDGNSVMKRTGANTFVRLSEDRVANTDLRYPDGTVVKKGDSVAGLRGDPVTIDKGFRGAHTTPTTGINKFSNQYNLNSLTKYNLGDIRTAIERVTGQSFQVADAQNIQDFAPVPITQSGEVFTQESNPANPNDFIIKSNKQDAPVVERAPSALAQQAMDSGQAMTPPTDITQVRAPVAPETFDINKFNQAIASNNVEEARRIGSLPPAPGQGATPVATPATAVAEIQSATDVATKAAEAAGLPAFQPGATVTSPTTAVPTQAGLDNLAQVTQAPVGSPQATADVIQSSTQAAQTAADVAGVPFTPGATVTPQGAVQTTPAGNDLLMQRYAEAVKAQTPATTPGVIDVNAVSQTIAPVTVPTYTPPAPPQTADLKDLVTQAEQYFKPSPQEEQLKQQEAQYAALTGQFLSQDQRRAQLEQSQGLDAKNQTLKDLTDQLRNLNAQAATASATAEDRLAPTFAITGEQAGIERQRAVKAMGIAAQQQAAQGNISLALDLVDRQLKAEFDPIEAQLRVAELQMQSTRDAIQRGDVRATNALNMALDERARIINEQKQVIADQKTEKKDMQVLALQAIENGASALEAQSILNAGNFDRAIQVATPYLQPKPKATTSTASTAKPLTTWEIQQWQNMGYDVQPGDTMQDIQSRAGQGDIPVEKAVDVVQKSAQAETAATGAPIEQTLEKASYSILGPLGINVPNIIANLFAKKPSTSTSFEDKLKAEGL